jgi:serine protease Do
MKTKTIAVIAVCSLLPMTGFAQPPSVPPVPPSAPVPPVPPIHPKDRDRDNDKGPKVPVTFLGVETSEVPRVVSEQLGLARGFGLVVDYVVPDGPAATAGVQQNDILKMLNDQILMQPDQLSKLIRSYPEGTNITLTVLRKGQESKITVKLGKKEISSRKDFFEKRHRPNDNDLGFNFDFSDLPDMEALKDLGPAIRDVVRDARQEAMQASSEARREAMQATAEARREAQRATQEARREVERAREDARRAGKDLHVFSSDDGGGMRSTTIDLGKAQIVMSDANGEMKLEKVNGKKILTAKDPQGRLVFSGPVDSKEDLDKVPVDVRQRYDKLEQKDLPGVISTVSRDDDDEDIAVSNDGDDEEDADDEDGDDDDNEPAMHQVSYSYPRSFRMFNVTPL